MYNNRVLAIILGGGQGSRLYPLTHSRSKPAVPIAGKYRLVDIPLSNCINSDIKRIYVLTQFNSASLNRHIKDTYHFSFFSTAFVDVLAAEQTPQSGSWFQGTADAVRQSAHHMKRHDFDYVLILSGDQLYQMDFNYMIEEHIKKKADISIATLPVHANDATEFGILKTDENGYIKTFVEKPPKDKLEGLVSEVSDKMKNSGRLYLASMGIYIFNRDLLYKLLEDTNNVDFGKHIIPGAIQNYSVVSYAYEGYWTDIGNIQSFFEANLGLTDDIPQFDLYNVGMKIYTHARVLPTTKISGTTMDRTVVADGCIIHAAKIERSVIGIRSRIGKDSTVINTYMMGCDYYESLDEIARDHIEILMGVGERCYIKNAIIDKNCRIGDDVRIDGGKHLENAETNEYVIKDGIVVIKKGAVIPKGYVI